MRKKATCQRSLLEKLSQRKLNVVKGIAVYIVQACVRVYIGWTNLETALLSVVPRNDTCAVYRGRVTKSQTFITKIFPHRVWRARGTMYVRATIKSAQHPWMLVSGHLRRHIHHGRIDALGPLDTRITSISLAYVCCSTNDIYSAARSPGVNPTDITFLLNVNRPDVRCTGFIRRRTFSSDYK